MTTSQDNEYENEEQVDMFIEQPGTYEDSDDNVWEELDRQSISQAVVYSTDWTTETVLSQIAKENIFLNPQFQRRDAWTKKEKSKFVESVVLGLPIPQIVLAADREKRGRYIVLDGKQRLLTLAQFANIDSGIYEELKLTGLKISKELNNKTYAMMKEDSSLDEDVSAFENQPIRTVIIKNYPSEKFLYEVFLRLNTGSKSLSPQELRQALHPGGFVNYIDEASTKSEAIKEILGRKKPDFRMRDVELMIRYIGFNMFIDSYSGNLKDFMDKTCERLNADWSEKENEVVRLVGEFEEAHKLVKGVFSDNAYRKWDGEKYVNRFNRAIFDVMMYYFSDPVTREAAETKINEIEVEFKSICETDSMFVKSIESTTKSVASTSARLSQWGERLKSTGLKVEIPDIS